MSEIIASLIYIGTRWERVVNFTSRSLCRLEKNPCAHNEQDADLNVFEKRAILFLCQESNQNSSYVYVYSPVIIPITSSRLVRENLY
jgi:hypothetical protein